MHDDAHRLTQGSEGVLDSHRHLRVDLPRDKTVPFEVAQDTGQHLGEASFADAAALAEPANVWAAQTVWMRRIGGAVTAELVERWSDKIAAVDTFTPETVGGLIVSLFTDAPIDFP